MSTAAVQRHTAHVPAKLVASQRAADVARADELLERVEELAADARRLQALAEEEGDLRAATGALREATRITELLARLAGELREAAVNVNVQTAVFSSGAWLDLVRRLLSALEAYPEARSAVERVLLEAAT